jgi:enoyl-CoA hydratase/carnithine racemase
MDPRTAAVLHWPWRRTSASRRRRHGSARSSSSWVSGCDIGVSYTLPRIVGAGQAFDLILTARMVEADEALRIGLVSRVSTGSAVDDALTIAETLCSYGKFGLESTKQVLWANLEAPSLQAALHVENRSQILSSTSGEMKEATAAFANRKRG